MKSGDPTRRTRIVGIGGGTGLSALLHGLRQQQSGAQRRGLDITGVVSVADDGGSSGLLREDFEIPAVGDLRNCIVALSQANPLWAELFQHRFVTGDRLAGHALGNLIVAALVQRSGGLQAAVERLTRPMRLGGHLLPVTEQSVSLCAELSSGEVVRGESHIRERRGGIKSLWLEPDSPPAAAGVLEAIVAADAIVLGPGSLFTSVVPNLLVAGVADAIRKSGALRIFVCNLTSEPGETSGLDAADHLHVLERYLGHGIVDVCVGNSTSPCPPAAAQRADADGPSPVIWDAKRFAGTGTFPFAADLASSGSPGRHDPAKLAHLIVSLSSTLRRRSVSRPPRETGRASRSGAGLRVA